MRTHLFYVVYGSRASTDRVAVAVLAALAVPVILLTLNWSTPSLAHADEQAAKSAPAPVSAAAQVAKLDPKDKLVWSHDWSFYASRYTQLDGQYYACAKYKYGYPSSLYKTAAGLIEDATRSRSVQYMQNMVKNVSIKPDLDDAKVAVRALPSMDAGEYGHIHSVQVVQISGPKAMLVKQIWLIDAKNLQDEIRQAKAKFQAQNQEQNQGQNQYQSSRQADPVDNLYQFRLQLVEHQQKKHDFRSGGMLLLGFDTKGIKPDERWNGPQGDGLTIAIAGKKTIAYTRTGSRYSRDIEVTVALPVTAYQGRLTQDQFVKMLATRNLTLKQFLDLTAEEKKKDASQAVVNTIVSVEANRPQVTDDKDSKSKDAASKSSTSKYKKRTYKSSQKSTSNRTSRSKHED